MEVRSGAALHIVSGRKPVSRHKMVGCSSRTINRSGRISVSMSEAFLQSLFRQGAFQGATPKDAYSCEM